MNDEVTAYANALKTTTDRYLNGCLSQATWNSHMRSLWGTIEHHGPAFKRAVLELVDPQSTAARRFVREEF